MLSTSIFRNAAALSVKRTVSARLAISAPMTARRAYATESGEGKTEQTANEESKNDQVPKEEETKVQGELSEEAKKLLAEKDKKISELQVNEESEPWKKKKRLNIHRMHTSVVLLIKRTLENVVAEKSRQQKNLLFKNLQRTF